MLTEHGAKQAAPGAALYEIDAGPPIGLVLRVMPSGAKSWALRYRVKATGERKRVTLGTYDPKAKKVDAREPAPGSLAWARVEARKVLGRVANGEDPSHEKKTNRKAMRMVDLLGDGTDEDHRAGKYTGWFLGIYVQTAGKLGTAKTPKGIANDYYYIAKYLRAPSFLAKRVDAVRVDDVNAIKTKVTPSTWRKLRNILIVCFRYAENEGVIPMGSNPATRTKATPDARKERYLTPVERQRLDAALTKAEEIGPQVEGGLGRHLVRALRLLALTGMRRGEVVSLRWEMIDFRHKVIRLPSSKTGARVVPLTPQAVAYLKAERGSTSRVGLVVATKDGKAVHPENIERAWVTIRGAKAANLPDVRLHDLRHSFASDAVSAGVPLYVVGAALGHRQPTTTARYSHLHDKAIKDGLAKAGAAIEAATKGGAK